MAALAALHTLLSRTDRQRQRVVLDLRHAGVGCVEQRLATQLTQPEDVPDQRDTGRRLRRWARQRLVLRPPSIVRSALRAGGTFGYANPNVYVHDMMGLTDRHVTLHGTVYYRSIGKTDLAYTYDAVRPNLILVHSGYNLLSRMVRASDGEYNDTYSLTRCRARACSPARNALCGEHPQGQCRAHPAGVRRVRARPVTVPDFDDSAGGQRAVGCPAVGRALAHTQTRASSRTSAAR
jgi:hypothetical protein